MGSWIPGVEPVLAFKLVSLFSIFGLGLVFAVAPVKVCLSLV